MLFRSLMHKKDVEIEKMLVVRLARRFLPLSSKDEGDHFIVREDGRLKFTLLFLVLVVVEMTDLIFALDSIPAIFGLTNDPYIIFTANALALMGLRQLYFLIGGLLERLVYLSAGLSVILGFIGIKMIFEALRGSEVHAVGPVPVPHIGTPVSLAVILAALAVTTLASLRASRRTAR